MKLFIIRHAWAADIDGEQIATDRERPLTAAGRERFTDLVAALAARGLEADIIATSPLVRCRQTAEVVARKIPGEPQIVELDALAPESDLQALIAWTNRQQVQTAIWVGHAPDVSWLTAALIGDAQANLRFAKGAVAKIVFDGEVEPGLGELHWLATAKLLGY